MTEPQFLEIVKQQELKTGKTVVGEKVTHHITLGDGHTLIVMFDRGSMRLTIVKQSTPMAVQVIRRIGR